MSERLVVKRLPLPQRGRTYTYEEIANQLELTDTPYLAIMINHDRSVIQTSHLTQEQMLAVPGMAESLWSYVSTTSEWIPVFTYVGPEPILKLVDVAESSYDPNELWVTPKGHPRPQ